MSPSAPGPGLGAPDKADVAKSTYSSPGRSGLNHPILVIFLVIVGLVVGVAAAYVPPVRYKAQTRLIVGKTTNANNVAAVAGLATAGNQIALNYARLVGTSVVSDDVRRQLGYEPGGSLTASEVPLSPTILIEATGSSAQAASLLAGAGSKALMDAVAVINQQTSSQQQALLQQYTAAAAAQASRQQTVNTLQGQLAALGVPGLTSAAGTAIQAQLVNAQANLSAASLQTQAVQSEYQSAAAPNQQASMVLTSLGGPLGEGDNRHTNLEIGGIGGLVGGLIVGFAIASLIDVRAVRRASRRSKAGASSSTGTPRLTG